MGTSEVSSSSRSDSRSKKGFFDMLFVGLFCFKRADRVAVMPDARKPADPSVAPHLPFIVVDPAAVKKSVGWAGNDPNLTAEGIYLLDKCTIDITRATTVGKLDADQHDENVFRLRELDGTYEFAGGPANTIAEIKLGQGTLELRRRPNRESVESDADMVTRLRVPADHTEDITITVKVDGEKDPRILTLEPETDIAIANALLALDPAKTGNPFTLFGGIAKTGTVTAPGAFPPRTLRAIKADYQVFRLARPVGDGGGGGGQTGCCPP